MAEIDPISFTIEPLTDALMDELAPLLNDHYQEISANKDIPLEPVWDAYLKLQEVGAFKVYTARKCGRLVGYAAFYITPHMHYKSMLMAQQDVLFVAKEHRRGTLGIRLIRFADSQLKTLGVTAVTHHVKAAHNFGAILERMGYKILDIIYSKRL